MRGSEGEQLLGLANCRLSTCCMLAAILGCVASGWWWVQLYSGWDGGVEREIGLATQIILGLLPPLEHFLKDLEQRR